jgi:hypothetical protein
MPESYTTDRITVVALRHDRGRWGESLTSFKLTHSAIATKSTSFHHRDNFLELGVCLHNPHNTRQRHEMATSISLLFLSSRNKCPVVLVVQLWYINRRDLSKVPPRYFLMKYFLEFNFFLIYFNWKSWRSWSKRRWMDSYLVVLSSKSYSPVAITNDFLGKLTKLRKLFPWIVFHELLKFPTQPDRQSPWRWPFLDR